MEDIKKEEIPENISYVAYESAMARAEQRYDKLLKHFKLVIILWFSTIVLAGGAFFWYLTLPVDEVSDTVTQDTDSGGNNSSQIIGGDYHGSTDNNKESNTSGKSSTEAQ